jgi:hypothetical protein
MVMAEVTARHFNAYIRLLKVSACPLETLCMETDHINLFKMLFMSEYLETPQ